MLPATVETITSYVNLLYIGNEKLSHLDTTSTQNTSNADITNCFTCFPRLPPEIRLKIWAEANNDESQSYLFSTRWANHTLRPYNKYKSIYSVNTESRTEAMRLNPPLNLGNRYQDLFHLFEPESATTTVPFNPMLDAIVFTECICSYNMRTGDAMGELSWLAPNQSEMRKIRNITLQLGRLNDDFMVYSFMGFFKMSLQIFPNLVGITLLKPGTICSAH